MMRTIPIVLALFVHSIVVAGAVPPIVFPLDSMSPQTDPFPLRRVFLTPTQLAELSRTLDSTALIRMPLAEFEKRVRQTSRAQRAIGSHIATARYTATFTDAALSGTAEWTVQNPSVKPSTLLLDPMRIALSKPTWIDGTPAILYRTEMESDERSSVAVWVDGLIDTNGRKLQSQWSARATNSRDDRRFELQFPACALSSLELSLPLPLTPDIHHDNALLTGPFESPIANHRRWHIEFGGSRKLELAVKSATANKVASPGASSTTVRWTLSTIAAEGLYQFSLDRHHQARDDYRFTLDPRVRIVQIVADGAIDWNVISDAAVEGKSIIRIRPVDSVPLNRITITVAAESPKPGMAWTVPAIRILGGLPADESVSVRLAADLRPTFLHLGDFRFTESDATEAGRQSLSFEGTFAKESRAERLLPSLTFDERESRIAVVERTHWDVQRNENRLRIVAQITALRGPVHQLSWTLPSEYSFVAPPSLSTDPSAEWHAGANSTLELTRPLATGQTTTLTATIASRTTISAEGTVRCAVPAISWHRAERTGTAHVHPSAEFSNATPFVVAYQDLPPPGETIFQVETRCPVSDSNPLIVPASAKPITVNELSTSPTASRWEVHIGDRRVTTILNGTTSPTLERMRIPIPVNAVVDSLEAANRWVEHPIRDRGEIELPNDPASETIWELKYHVPRMGWWIERLEMGNEEHSITWSAEPGWWVWSSANGHSVWVVRSALLKVIGCILACLLLLPVSTIIANGAPRNRANLILILTAVLCGPLALSGWADFAAVMPTAVAILGLAASAFRHHPRTVATMILLVGCPAIAHSPTVSTVYILYGTQQDSNQLFVLVPQSVLDQLTRLTATTPPAVIVTNAEYRGTESTDEVSFEADWNVLVSASGAQRISIPLQGVKLVTLTLDGVAAFPEPLATDGFTVMVNTSGMHHLHAQLTVPVKHFGTENEARFIGPDVPYARLIFQSHVGTRGISISSRRGQQIQTPNERGTLVTADLGDGRTVSVRWRPLRAVDPISKIEAATEVAICDCEEGTTTILAGFLYPASRVGPRYRMAIPEGWDVVRVLGRQADTGSAIAWDWSVTNAPTRIVTATARSFVEGRIAIVLELASDRVQSTRPTISFPRDLDAPDPTATYAVRLRGIAMDEFHHEGAIDIPIDAIVRDASGFPEFGLDTQPANRAVRRNKSDTIIRPVFAAVKSAASTKASLTWTIGRRSDLFSEWTWSGTIPGLATIIVPESYTSLSVRGTDLLDWNRRGNQLSLWMRTSDDSGTVRWSATLGDGPLGERVLPLPRTTSQTPTVVRIRPTSGWRVQIVPMKGVEPVVGQPELFTVDPSVISLRVVAEHANAPPPTPLVPAIQNLENPVPQLAPAKQKTDREIAVPHPFPFLNSLYWLTGLLCVVSFKRLRTVDLLPEQIVGLGVLGYVAASPFFVALIVVGLIVRLVRMVR